MDQSSRSLLDLLNRSESRSKSSDKDELLKLFGPAPVKAQAQVPPPVTTPVNRNGNANDLLAALMGSGSPRRGNEENSANLLSSLMGTGHAYAPTQSVVSPGAVAAPKSYLNPRHEYLKETPTASAEQKTQGPSNGTKAFFTTTNPFDALEAMDNSIPQKQTHDQVTRVGGEEQSLAPTVVPLSNDNSLATPKVRHASMPATTSNVSNPVQKDSTAMRSQSVYDGTLQDKLRREDQGVKSRSNSPMQVTPKEASSGEEQSGSALRLPADSSSVIKVSSAKCKAFQFHDATPVTKMTIKPDPINRNIISASRKYIAYPLSKDGSPGLIRIVDQDTGGTCVLTQHTTKVVSVIFAKTNDEDGKNALISTDSDSSVVVWTIQSIEKVDKVFEIAGPSDTSHKARANWNRDGTYFGVSITSRVYVFDYRAVASAPRNFKVKLHPEMKHVLCICKAEKAIRDYAFSLDNTSIAAVDKAGHVKMYNLDSTGKTVSALLTIVPGEKALLSVTFVGQRHLVVGGRANESLVLVDIQSAKSSQELRLPVQQSKETMATTSKVMYLAKTQTLVLSGPDRGLYFAELSLPSVTEAKTSEILSRVSTESSHLEASGSYKTFYEISAPQESSGKWLDYTCIATETGRDVLAAHENGYTLYSPSTQEIERLLQEAQSLDSANVSRMQSIGRLVLGEETVKDDIVKTRSSSPDQDRSVSFAPRVAKKTVKSTESGPSMVTEPRTAELAAKIESNLRTTMGAEFTKSNTLIKSQIDKLQADNDARHETVLRLISETLSKNTTQVLKNSINDVMEKTLLPLITQTVDASVAAHLSKSIATSLDASLEKHLATATLGAVHSAFESAGIVAQVQAATSSMSSDLGARHKHMEQDLAGALVRLDAQILERQRTDSEKIDKLLEGVKALEGQVATLSTAVQQADEKHKLALSTPTYPQPSQVSSPYQSRRAVPQTAPVEDYTKYHDLIMDFVGKSQKISTGDYEGVPFIRQFLSWRPEVALKEGICKSLSSDQLQLLAFVHALASELTEEQDAFNRIHWIGSALGSLSVEQDPRLATLGPQLTAVVRANLSKALGRAPTGSPFGHLLEVVLGKMTGR